MLRRAAVGAVLLAVVLAGCSGEPETGPEASPSATVSDSPSASATNGSNTEEAEAFVIRYFEEVIYSAYVTGDTSVLRALSDPKCQVCNAIAGDLDAIYEKEGSIRVKPWATEIVRVGADGVSVRITLTLKTPRERYIGPNGRIVRTTHAQEGTLDAVVKRADGQWIMQRWEQL